MEIISTLATAVSTIKTAADALATFKSTLRDQTPELIAANDAILKAQVSLIEVHQMVLALQTENVTLKDELRTINDFSRDKEQYALQPVGLGTFAYVHKDLGKPEKNTPLYCQNCMDHDAKTSIFQFVKHEFHFDLYQCHRCNSAIKIPNDIKMEAMTAPISNRFDDY